MSNSSCEAFSPSEAKIISIVIAATNGFSVFVCLLAAILVCCLDLYTKAVYRLALYQVLSSLGFSLVFVVEVVFGTSPDRPSTSTVYFKLCTAIGWFSLYTQWTKLLFTTWVTIHLFCFAVLHKNLKKLEVLYVVTSLLVPAVIASVPLITGTYHLTPFTTCWIYDADTNSTTHVGDIEAFTLWYGPALIVLIASSTAMVVMVFKLSHRVRWRLNYEQISDGDQFMNALKQLLPLAAFPVLFCIFVTPPFIFHVYEAMETASCPFGLYLASSVCFSLWTMTSGLVLIVHISLTKGPAYKRGVVVTPSHTCTNDAEFTLRKQHP